MVDARGLPLAALLTAANVTDSVVFEHLLERIPSIRLPYHRRGHPRRRPAKLHGDKGYDKPHCRRYCQRYHIGCRLARIVIESSDRLGRHRWVVERTLAWLGQFRRLTIRYERRLDIHQAFLTLACSLICWNFVQRFC